jgi:predicted transposase YdaD
METKQDIAAYTEILPGLQFEKDFIRQLLSEDIMKESVIYQDIFQKGELKFCPLLLNQRFGEIDPEIIGQIKVLPIEQPENLGAALFNIPEVADLVNWLNRALAELTICYNGGLSLS